MHKDMVDSMRFIIIQKYHMLFEKQAIRYKRTDNQQVPLAAG